MNERIPVGGCSDQRRVGMNGGFSKETIATAPPQGAVEMSELQPVLPQVAR
ncbi:hypothetical protein [Sulfitobacter alexandrii]|uniref:hypothetical protein n=1 Tax=Sulfitobacter alexandrii TaxID=1917485 RepID=UPI001560F4A2|nr:hypothetical protein [Sulfitobacter alexandrii]